MESTFQEDNHIFVTKEPFDEDFVPEDIFERDTVFEEYTRHLQDIVDGFGPPNIFIYGDSGLGKTAVTEKMMEFLQAETDKRDIDLTVITINCNKRNSTYSVIRHLANELHPDEHFNQGHHDNQLWEHIYEKMDEIGGDFLFILDEIDQLGDDDTLLYEFPRARAMGEIDDARVGVIGISNNYLYRENLRTRVKSTLCEDEIEFNPYDATELRTILNYYSDLVFKDDVLTCDVIPYCAAITAQETGDARLGLDLLEHAGEIAQHDDASQITEEHVKHARHEVERAKVKEMFRKSLTVQQQLVLIATTFLVIKRKERVRVNTIYDTYDEFADIVGCNNVTRRRVREFAKTLREKGLLESDEKNLGGNGGRWYRYSTVIAPRTVLEAMEESDSRFGDLLSSDIRAELDVYEREVGDGISMSVR